jgi:chromosome segregation ATPase
MLKKSRASLNCSRVSAICVPAIDPDFLVSVHDSSLAELRDVHRLESASQSEQIESLKKQLKEAEILLSASTIHSSANEASMKSLRDEVNSSQKIAKDEEEKRVKAVALLKTVRQKLVKTEKERDDALKASQEARQKADELLSKDQAEKNAADATLQRLKEEYERKLLEIRSERQKEVQQIRAAAEGEISAVKESYETEIHSLKVRRIILVIQQYQCGSSRTRLHLRARQSRASSKH